MGTWTIFVYIPNFGRWHSQKTYERIIDVTIDFDGKLYEVIMFES
jgi:hypothetical protein